jgi:hypothetical protein
LLEKEVINIFSFFRGRNPPADNPQTWWRETMNKINLTNHQVIILERQWRKAAEDMERRLAAI